MQPTLVILAAGIGTRYGGLKQLEPLGPGGETLLEYSVFDAPRTGFSRVVLVVRPETEICFRHHLEGRLPLNITTSDVHQAVTLGREFMVAVPRRQKPWGTRMARADRRGAGTVHARQRWAQHRRRRRRKRRPGRYSGVDEHVGFHARGLPAVAGPVPCVPRGGLEVRRPGRKFLIPDAIQAMISDGTARVRVLSHDGQSCGTTFPDNRHRVRESIARRVAAGEYPQRLWA